MNVDLFTMTGEKHGTVELPSSLFDARGKEGLVHQFLMLQQGNRRRPIASTLSRGQIRGSTRKLFAQKGTGRARRGSIRSTLLRGGNKAFGPKSTANFRVAMPRGMRHAALRACLALQAKRGVIFALQGYPEDVKTKTAFALLQKLPVDIGRRILFVTGDPHRSLRLSTRNIPGVKTVGAAYLNPEDVLVSRSIIFLVDAFAKAEQIFAHRTDAPVPAEEKPKAKAKTSAKAKTTKPKKSPRTV